jgi:hypothetical protein
VKRVAIVLAVLLVVPLLAGSASAAEKGLRRYRAETSDGQFLRFRTVRDEGGRRLDGVFFEDGFQLSCDDGTTQPWGGAGFSQWPWYLEDGTVTVDEWTELGTWALHIQGTFRPALASGTFRYTEVFLNEDEAARRCSTGDLTWTAERVN